MFQGDAPRDSSHIVEVKGNKRQAAKILRIGRDYALSAAQIVRVDNPERSQLSGMGRGASMIGLWLFLADGGGGGLGFNALFICGVFSSVC